MEVTAGCACGSLLRPLRCCAMDPAGASPPGSAAMLAPQIRAAEEARQGGDDARALAILQEVLELAPWSPAALSVLARLHRDAGRLGAAATLLARIVAVDPANHAAQCEAARTALDRGDIAGALTHARNAVRGDPLSADAHHLLGVALTEANRPVPGEHHYRRALALAAGLGGRPALVLANLAWNLKQQGRITESRALYAEARAAAPAVLTTLLGEARMEEAAGNLDRAAAVLDEAAALAPRAAAVTLAQAVVAARRGARDQALAMLDGMAQDDAAAPAVLMEKGRLLDRMDRPQDAFAAWTAGKQRLRDLTGQEYEAAAAEDEAARLRGFFTPPRRRLLPRAQPAAGPQPVFILGFPRSGTTLVEQTLSAHPAIAAGDELPLVGDLAAMVPRVLSSPLPYPAALADLWMGDEADGLETLRDHYLRRVRSMGIVGPGQAWFTDKMPLNEWHMGLIGMVFPASPMILLVRHPLDVVLSVFGNELTHGFRCAFALESAARHFALTAELVAHYRASLALRLLAVRYEDLIDAQEPTVRAMLAFLGLPFDLACLAPHANTRAARTASYAQVTEPLYRRSRYRYHAYRDLLAPVIPILAPAIARLGYTI
ncbi:MAG: sulfotransferase [Acetobacteraceae bacterium]|nr:sulfotransferase [Acetobacteraceae bacterium]